MHHFSPQLEHDSEAERVAGGVLLEQLVGFREGQ